MIGCPQDIRHLGRHQYQRGIDANVGFGKDALASGNSWPETGKNGNRGIGAGRLERPTGGARKNGNSEARREPMSFAHAISASHWQIVSQSEAARAIPGVSHSYVVPAFVLAGL